MQQTKLESGIEIAVNTVIGYGVSMILWPVIGHITGVDTNNAQHFWIVSLFTVVSIIRQYIVRRYFNAGLHKLAVKAAQQIGDKLWPKS